MPISLEQAADHINYWSERLGTYSYWPRYLYFTAHITAAAQIIRSGKLFSRQNCGFIAHDIANKEALASNRDAWRYVRLYFRPKTSFHLKTEGIKLLTDRYRQDPHMSVPILFVFHFANVVTFPGVSFSDRKMAHVGMIPGSDWSYFSRIDFAKVYHEGPLSQAEISHVQDIRMAEVLVPDELELANNLAFIISRTNFEANSLRWRTQDRYEFVNSYLRVATRPTELFFCRGCYLEELSFVDRLLTFKIKPSLDYIRGQQISLQVQRHQHNQLNQQWQSQASIDSPIRLSGFEVENGGHWRIEVERALAFEAELQEKVLVYR